MKLITMSQKEDKRPLQADPGGFDACADGLVRVVGICGIKSPPIGSSRIVRHGMIKRLDEHLARVHFEPRDRLGLEGRRTGGCQPTIPQWAFSARTNFSAVPAKSE